MSTQHTVTCHTNVFSYVYSNYSSTVLACHVRPLTVETLFTKLHPTVTPKWQKLGELLGMDEDLLDEIYVNNERDEECLRVLLEVWLQKSTNPTWKIVTNALAKIGKNHCISDKSQCSSVY